MKKTTFGELRVGQKFTWSPTNISTSSKTAHGAAYGFYKTFAKLQAQRCFNDREVYIEEDKTYFNMLKPGDIFQFVDDPHYINYRRDTYTDMGYIGLDKRTVHCLDKDTDASKVEVILSGWTEEEEEDVTDTSENVIILNAASEYLSRFNNLGQDHNRPLETKLTGEQGHLLYLFLDDLSKTLKDERRAEKIVQLMRPTLTQDEITAMVGLKVSKACTRYVNECLQCSVHINAHMNGDTIKSLISGWMIEVEE